MADGTAPNTSMSAKKSTRVDDMRSATERMTPSTICVRSERRRVHAEKVGFHLKPSMIGYVNSSLATVTAALASSAGATNTR